MTDAVVEIDLTPFSGKPKKREPLHRRTGSAVRRRSRIAGEEKGTPVTWTQRRLRLDAFDKIARDQRQRGQRWGGKGLFSRIDREILSELLTIAARARGQVYPTLASIADLVGCSIRSVVEGLRRLKAAGFIRWDRRYVETGEQGLRGPQVKQTSNFYHLELPTAAAALIDLWRRKRAPKEDEAAEAERQARADFAERCRKADIEATWRARGGDPPSVQRILAKTVTAKSSGPDRSGPS
ncbi:hypothetical protein [Caulobacter sp. 1776]|uniref:helix-turn-helix domain-containing protein n=1 Tax=Caulobacter sp. 1776 TaxID=3156420 RepID=UPI00339339C2